VLDEIFLKCGFKYGKKEDKIMGFEHFGESDESDKVALVFMARGLFDRWKQPLAYFFAHNSSPAAKMHELGPVVPRGG